MRAVMEDAAQAAAALGLHDVAAAIRAAFVDDVSTSLDDMEKLNQLKTDLGDFLHSRSLPIKGFRHIPLTHRQHTCERTALVPGNRYDPATHTCYIPRKESLDKFRTGTTFLTDSITKDKISTFYKDFPLTLAHIRSRTASLYDQS